MTQKTELLYHYDVSSREDVGTRAQQEDCLATEFCVDAQAGLAVLADGMGGHDDGSVASRFLVSGVAGELMYELDDFAELASAMPERLRELTKFANEQLSKTIDKRGLDGTVGATLVSVAISSDQMYWASVGDSPLYLFRNGALKRLNADHSMSQQIDFMVEAGMISEEKAKNHPDRNILTSAVRGKDVTKIDCPTEAFELLPNDIIILSSDGLNVLGMVGIASVLRKTAETTSDEIAGALIAAVTEFEADQKDNTSFALIKVSTASNPQLC